MNPTQRILITIGIGLILVLSFYIITNAITRYTGFFVTDTESESDFQACLKEKEITLYINANNPSEVLKEISLQQHLSDIKIKNCLRDNTDCLNNKVTSFPSWVINENLIDRDINFKELEQFSGCVLIK